MANLSLRRAVANIAQGIPVEKSTTAIAGISTKDLFTVVGGNCIILGIIGEVTTVVQALLNNARLLSTPTVGTAQNLCANVDITGHEVGGLYTITGVFATAGVKGNAGAGVIQSNPVVVPPGVIGFNTSADATGAYKWYVWYIPAEDGAYIEAA
jgi:hypothetical protein